MKTIVIIFSVIVSTSASNCDNGWFCNDPKYPVCCPNNSLYINWCAGNSNSCPRSSRDHLTLGSLAVKATRNGIKQEENDGGACPAPIGLASPAGCKKTFIEDVNGDIPCKDDNDCPQNLNWWKENGGYHGDLFGVCNTIDQLCDIKGVPVNMSGFAFGIFLSLFDIST